MVYLITGKPGAGKTTYAMRLYEEFIADGKMAVVIDADKFREKTGNQDFSDEGRIRNLMDAAREAQKLELDGNIVIMAFVSPRKEWRNEMRRQWIESRLIYIPGGKLWEGTKYEVPDDEEMGEFYHPDIEYSWFIGRFQPFHHGHEMLIKSVLMEGKPVCILLRTTGKDKDNPYSYIQRKKMIENRFPMETKLRLLRVMKAPDINEVCYGRKVGWGMRRIYLDDSIEVVSATNIRLNEKNATVS